MAARALKPVDVYEIATEIGREFETIIDTFGAGALTSLVPKVIQALEQLERLSLQREQEGAALHELRKTVERLEAEKAERAAERRRFEKELEEFEERTREETQKLVTMVTDLQTENRRMVERREAERNGDAPEQTRPEADESETDLKVLMSLKAVIDRQKEDLSVKDAQLHEQNSQVEKLQSDMDRLKKQVREQKRRQRVASGQQRQLNEERTLLEVELTDVRRQMTGLRQQLGTAQKENLDLSQSVDTSQQNKVVYDRDDPARPRFTFSELRDILNERNELKARLSDLQDELTLYRPSALDTSKSSILCPPSDDLDSFSSSDLSSPPSLQNELDQQKVSEEDLPVHGPLPQDPDDAPWKRSESGIRRLIMRQLPPSIRRREPAAAHQRAARALALARSCRRRAARCHHRPGPAATDTARTLARPAARSPARAGHSPGRAWTVGSCFY
ncbi:RILP-like protein homolog isoform X2 [Pollicipes pollicipes]|uniref:RILP-like protein homolog isoform X2 n=1 Tax=Pollicipes pollicipes TaxID=41117 RepID=UPI0018854AE1|nr:RILP-like protein homolog isoform X2 [Pollicipes pollicipes]